MSTLRIYRGVPGSGKTTEALKWLAAGDNRTRINRDDIRFSMFGKYWGVDEKAVTVMQEALTVAAMRKGLDIVSDNTNLKAANVKDMLRLAHKWGYGVEFQDFPIAVDVAITRDHFREKRVGADVIQSFFDRYLKDGKFPPIPELPTEAEFPKHEWTPGLPEAIIVDLDGTLAIHNGRSPYDDSLIYTDILDRTVYDIVERFSNDGYWIIYLSGRDEGRARALTEHWLHGKRADIYDHLYMRPAGDKRNDAVVKNELFEKHIAGKYNVLFALDDRNRVVDMWRAKGIKCLQCEPGDF